MSIVRMRKIFRTRKRVKIGKRHMHLPSPAEFIFYLIILIFVVGAYYTFGGPARSHRDEYSGRQGRVSAIVAVVNGEKIPRSAFEARLALQEDFGREKDITQERWLKMSILNSLIDEKLTEQAVKREGIKITKEDVKKKIEEEVTQTINLRFSDEKAKFRYLKKQGKTPQQLEDEIRREISKDKERLQRTIAEEKLRQLVEQRVTLTDEELKESFTEIRASHILIKPEEELKRTLKNAGSKPEQADADTLARQKAEKLLAQLKNGADFAKLAREHSDDPGSAPKGGDLGFFRKGMMVREFEEAAFKLQPGQISEIVKSPFGYHIIKISARKTELPKDFEKNKNVYREQVLSERKFRAWQEYQETLKAQAKIEIRDKELLAYKLLEEAAKSGTMDKLKQMQAKQLLEEAVKENPGNATAMWELAALYEQEGNKQRAVELLEAASAIPEGAAAPMLHVKLGELYEALKQKDKAIAEYQNAFDRASTFTPANYFTNMQIEQKLKAMGETTLVKQVTQWLEDYRKEQAKNPAGGFGPMGMPITIPGR